MCVCVCLDGVVIKCLAYVACVCVSRWRVLVLGVVCILPVSCLRVSCVHVLFVCLDGVWIHCVACIACVCLDGVS